MTCLPPTPARIAAAQRKAGDSDVAAAARVYVDRTTWYRWRTGSRAMPLATWALYLHVTGQRVVKVELADA